MKALNVVMEGQGQLIGWHDPDENRSWICENKQRALIDKRMTLHEAITNYVKDGDVIASGGFGHIRVSMAAVYEIVRQKKQGLTLCGKTAVHDSDILIAAGCVNRVEVAYAFGHELRGLSPASRRAIETGSCCVVAEISNAGYQWRFLAGAMGIPFIPSRVMLGTDTFKKSSAKIVEDPFSGKPICLIPSCCPDVVIIHVHRCDKYGNAQIDGISVEDFELSRAARRLILTAEEIIDEEEIRDQPWHTIIPYYLVDAVVLVPFGAHPTLMPLRYTFDEDHIREWLQLSKTIDGVRDYINRYIIGVNNYTEYLELIGSMRLRDLQQIEQNHKPPFV